jgi:hypothetical protein
MILAAEEIPRHLEFGVLADNFLRRLSTACQL